MDDELSMEPEGKRKKKKGKSKVVLILLVVLLLAGAGGGYWYWDTNMNQPAPMPMPRKQAAKKPSAQKAKPKAQNTSEAQAEKEGFPSVPEYGNLQEYAKLEAEADLLRKKKEVIALQQEINKIEGVDTKKEAEQPKMTAQDIQNLISQEVGRQLPGSAMAPKLPPVDQIPVVFISIEGVGNNISAKVRELNGAPVTLRAGSSFRGGKVTSVLRNGITVKIDGKRIFYPFQ